MENPKPESTPRLITSAAVRKIFGVSDMALWRWAQNPELDFPAPIRIGTRRYWRETDITAWINDNAAKAQSAKPQARGDAA
jgi:predicted DNA-binding transcriptional regulator AlpA